MEDWRAQQQRQDQEKREKEREKREIEQQKRERERDQREQKEKKEQESRQREQDFAQRQRESREREHDRWEEEEHEEKEQASEHLDSERHLIKLFWDELETAKDLSRSGELFASLGHALRTRANFKDARDVIEEPQNLEQLSHLSDRIVELTDNILREGNVNTIIEQGFAFCNETSSLLSQAEIGNVRKIFEQFTGERPRIPKLAEESKTIGELDKVPVEEGSIKSPSSDIENFSKLEILLDKIEQNLSDVANTIDDLSSRSAPLRPEFENLLSGEQRKLLVQITDGVSEKLGVSYDSILTELDFLVSAPGKVKAFSKAVALTKENLIADQRSSEEKKLRKRKFLIKLITYPIVILIGYFIIQNIREKNAAEASGYRDAYLQALNSKDETSAASILKEHFSDLSEVAVVAAAAHNMTTTAIAAIDEHANIDKGDETGFSAIHYAVDHNDTKLMTSLLKNGADVNKMVTSSSADGGQTALIRAVKQGDDKIVKMLLSDSHIDLNIRDLTGKSAEDYASEMNKKNILHLIKIHKKKS